MDQSAIQQLQKMALAAVSVEQLEVADQPLALVPENYKIKSLEEFELAPSQHRERFRTKYLSEFFAYTCKHAGDGLTVFIDEEAMSAKAIIDRSSSDSPSWQNHTAKLQLEKTPALNALLVFNDSHLSQDELIDFAIDWKEHIVFYDGEEALAFNDALSRLRKLKVSKSSPVESNRGDFKASASAIEQIAIDAADAPLPSRFEFTTEPYLQFDNRIYTGQLRALGDDNKPVLKYRLMSMPAMEQAIAEEFKQRINKELEGATIHIGTI